MKERNKKKTRKTWNVWGVRIGSESLYRRPGLAVALDPNPDIFPRTNTNSFKQEHFSSFLGEKATESKQQMWNLSICKKEILVKSDGTIPRLFEW